MTISDDTAVRDDIAALIAEVFNYRGPLTQDMVREDVPRWDSLRHVGLVVAIESKFGVSLSMDEMHEIESIRDVHKILERHGK